MSYVVKAATIGSMKSRRSLLPIFFLFLFLSLGIFFTSQTPFGSGITGFFEQLLLPLQKTIVASFWSGSKDTTPEAKLREENIKLQILIAKQEDLKKENNAFRDQFKTTAPAPKQLIPAQIIGGENEEIILDMGTADGVKNGNIIILKENVIGRIASTSLHRSVGELVTKSNITFAAKTAKTSALGIVRGRGSGNLVLANVVLADKLEKNDLVVTKGDLDQQGKGFPPDLIVGKIISVNKRNSDLFQSAEIEPLVKFNALETVFIMGENN